MSENASLSHRLALAVAKTIESFGVKNNAEDVAAIQIALAAVNSQAASKLCSNPTYATWESHKRTDWHMAFLMQMTWLSLPLADQGGNYSYRIAVGHFAEALFVRLVARNAVERQEGQDAAKAMLEAFGLIYGGVYCSDLLNALSDEAKDSFHARLREAIEIAAMRVRKDFEALVPGVSAPRGDLN